jgi:hypothetical protein
MRKLKNNFRSTISSQEMRRDALRACRVMVAFVDAAVEENVGEAVSIAPVSRVAFANEAAI